MGGFPAKQRLADSVTTGKEPAACAALLDACNQGNFDKPDTLGLSPAIFSAPVGCSSEGRFLLSAWSD